MPGRLVILQCIDKAYNHNKFYEIKIEEPTKKTFTVTARWGRIEHFKDGKPQKQVKLQSNYLPDAEDEVNKLIEAKKKKGYKVYKDETLPLESNKQPKLTEKKNLVDNMPIPFERTEHKEVALDWWTSFEEIEDRAV
jgi:predicted DNA-binding WGR domain protein